MTKEEKRVIDMFEREYKFLLENVHDARSYPMKRLRITIDNVKLLLNTSKEHLLDTPTS